MKKVLFFMVLLMTLCINAQTTIFEENFDSTPDYELPSGWTTTRNPSTLYRPWYCSTTFNTNGLSGQACTSSTQTADDYINLATPEITLAPNYSYSLNFLLLQIYASNIFAVYVLPAGAVFTGSENPVFQQEQGGMTTASQQDLDLSPYAGQNIKIYFRSQGVRSDWAYTQIDNVKITQQAALGTSEITSNKTMGIYPNPTSDFVYLKTGSKIIKAEVFDMAGRKVNVAVKDDKIDVRALQPGTYMINAETKNKKYSHRFIKK